MNAAAGQLREYVARFARQPISHRRFCEHALYCQLELSPLVGAVIDAAEGAPVTLDDGTARRHFGCPASQLPRKPLRTIAARTGGRGGKTSRLIATKALHAAWTVPLPTLARGEVARSLIVAPKEDLALQALSFVRGYVEGSPILSRYARRDVSGLIELERPDGKRVAIEVRAASRGGRGVRSMTLVFAGLDEAAFFYAEGSGVVNDLDILNAVEQRVVPGGQVWIVSTPWLEGSGVLERTIAQNFGKHEHALAVTAGTRAMNPSWDPDGTIEQELRARSVDAGQREIDGIPLASGEATFFDPRTIDASVDPMLHLPRAPKPGEQVLAGGDLGLVSDSSALIVGHLDGPTAIVGDLLELRPSSEPLKPSTVLSEFKAVMAKHVGLSLFVSDGHYREVVREGLEKTEISYKEAPASPDVAYVRARTLFREGRVRLPLHERLLAQLKAVQWRAGQGGKIQIVLPREKGGGHCDLVSALVLMLYEGAGLDVPSPARPWKPSEARTQAQWQEMAEQLERSAANDSETQERAWWE